jgi:FKBP-type peptidyl-prolyl cis-trans isomerase 2
MNKVLFACGLCLVFGLAQAGNTIGMGSQVKMEYTLTVEGKEVDSSKGLGPMPFEFGKKMIVPGLEKAMKGMKAGEEKVVSVLPENAYGMVNDKLVKTVKRATFPSEAKIEVGQIFRSTANGKPFMARVSAINGDEVTMDANHPMAGKTLNFSVKVVEVK